MTHRLSRFLLAAVFVSLATTSSLPAQDAQDDTSTPDPQEATQIQSSVIVAEQSDDGGPPKIQFFSSNLGMGGAATLTPMVGAASDMFAMASNPDIRKEIELVDDQAEELKRINAEFSRKLSEQFQSITNGNLESLDKDRIQDLLKQLNQEKRERMESVLLPHQLDRLKQVALQMNMKSRGTARALQSELAKELDITEEQVRRLKEREKQLNQELQEKIRQWKEDARKQLLEELTPQQRTKLNQLLGDKFETDINDFHPQAKH